MKLVIYILLAIALTLSALNVTSQERMQTIRGRVIDKNTKVSLPGANVIIPGSEPLKGTVTDVNGYFKIEGIPTGRISVEVSYMGYHTYIADNLILTSGKEVILQVELLEKILESEEVVIRADKTNPINQMATVSARQFSVEETQRYAGSRNDVARMATNYAGVAIANDAVNEIIIRGNSPNGLLWKMEGVEVPNPNHFGFLGSSGGAVSALNNNILSNSDFMTGAFPSEYGNALSGVFDLKIRNGNSQKFEFLGQVGFNGFEIGVEGPISKKNNSSFLVNYRYSTLEFMQKIGVDFGTGTAIPKYNDLSWKVHLPVGKKSVVNFFGLMGPSKISFIRSDKDADEIEESLYNDEGLDIVNDNFLAVVGLNHLYHFNKNNYGKLTIAYTQLKNEAIVDSINKTTLQPVPLERRHYNNQNYTISYTINSRLSSRLNLKSGITWQNIGYNLRDSIYKAHEERYITLNDDEGNTDLVEAYVSGIYRFNEQLQLNGGLHYQEFLLNNSRMIEPRLGIKYQLNPRHSLGLGYGLHSKTIPVYVYFLRVETTANEYYQPNLYLDFQKAHHFILSYDWQIMPRLRLKAETYYQKIFDAVVEEKESSFSLLNYGQTNYSIPDTLINGGTGTNMGFEITLEKFMDKGLYFLATVSLFDSKYKGSDGVRRSTAFDSDYVLNLLGGKDIQLFKNKENARHPQWLTIDARVSAAGGQRYTPLDLEESMKDNETVYDDENAFSERFDDYFRADLRVSYRVDGKKVSQEWAVDIQNFTNHKNPLYLQYNTSTGEEYIVYQLGIFPMMQYRILF